MAPVRQSARQKARGRPAQTTDPSSVDPARPLATAAATGVAQQRHLANSQVRQDTTASLRNDLDEIRDLLMSVFPGAASATPVPVAGPPEPPLPPLDKPGAGSVAPPLGLLPFYASLLGFYYDLYYVDAVLPMGCSSSCVIFESFSTALEWIAMNTLGATKMIHVLDDFLVLAESQDKQVWD